MTHNHVGTIYGVRANNDSPQRKRRSIRLQGYDYSQAGAYFVTICTRNRECLFGEIVDGEMTLNDVGRVTEECWYAIPDHFPHVGIDTHAVMPNHVHGILFIVDAPVGAKNFSPLPSKPRGTSKTIGSVIRGFKIGVTKWMRQSCGRNNFHPAYGRIMIRPTYGRINFHPTYGRIIIRPNNRPVIWQRNYYEHIIRNENELNRIREYIINNPRQWELDRENLDVDRPTIKKTRGGVATEINEPWQI